VRLAAHFDAAIITRVCECGCNSFDVQIESAENLLPLTSKGDGGMFFEADFALRDGRQIEVLVFCDGEGKLSGVDVQCQGNTEAVPDSPEFENGPFHVYISDRILTD
jgi:hypothetical protein